MELLPSHLNKIFNQTKEEYSKKIEKLPNIALFFVEEDKYLKDAKANPMNQILIKNGLFENFEKEYPGFLVVYEHDKSPLLYAMRGCYGVSVCYSLAKKWLKPFTTQAAFSYLRHGFAHEIAHVMEGIPKTDSIERKINAETSAEQIADLIENNKYYQDVETKLWHHVYKRAQGGIFKNGMD